MKELTLLFIGFSLAIAMGFSLNDVYAFADAQTNNFKNESMKLGAFSVSLSVKDLKVSQAFYEKLGFSALGGDLSKNYLIMKNENSLIGLFQGMFET